MAKVISELQNLRKLFNEVVVVDMFCGNDKEVAKEITLRHFLLVEVPLTVFTVLLFSAVLVMFG